MIRFRFIPMMAWCVLPALCAPVCCADEWSCEQREGAIRIALAGQPVADYVFHDPEITRPYFANLHSPAGVKLTRNHPPVAGEDRMDHPDFHPGLWLAFGDLSGADNWRLKAPVVHERFIEAPHAEEDVLRFHVLDRYESNGGGMTVCHARSRYTLRNTPHGMLLTWDTTFTGDHAFTFGDQEEMGLGLRVATRLRVEQDGPDPMPEGTGEIVDDQGRKNAEQIWGKAPHWIDYRGQIDDTPAGVALFCCPQNPHKSRMHARDYGFVCANPFAIAAFHQGEPKSVIVAPGESLRLRYGVLLHSGEAFAQQQLEESYRGYCRLAAPGT